MKSVQTVLKKGEQSFGAFKTRLDGWANLLTRLGTSGDKAEGLNFYETGDLTDELLEALFNNDDLAARIVTAVVDDALRQGFSVERSTEEGAEAQDAGAQDASLAEVATQQAALQKQLDALEFMERFREAAVWGRLYGGAAILLGVDDGQGPEEPLDLNRVKSLSYLTVLEKRDLYVVGWYNDPLEPDYGEPALYEIRPTSIATAVAANSQVSGLRIHESRLVFFQGEKTSRKKYQQRQGWHLSVLQKVYETLRAANQNWKSTVNMISDMSQAVFKIQGLIQMIASNEKDTMLTRMALTDLVRSVSRAIVLDAEEEDFKLIERNLTGVSDLLDKTWLRMAAAARMPVTILMGQSPAGLNATGESDLRWWYDTVKTYQEMELKPRMEFVVRLLAKAMFPTMDPEAWEVCFPSLWQMTPSEEADLRLKIANVDKTYLDAGVVLPEEVAVNRFGDDQSPYSMGLNIDLETRNVMLEAELETLIEKAQQPDPVPPPLPPPGTPPGTLPPSPQDPNAQQPPPPNPADNAP